jgi:large subunit ribosomal protein L21
MIAIVEIAGSQYKIQGNKKLIVPKLKMDAGSTYSIDKVLMFSEDDKSYQIGSPSLDMKIEATVLGHIKDDTVIVFKKKRRKGYKVRKGHRQQYTQLEIKSFGNDNIDKEKEKAVKEPKVRKPKTEKLKAEVTEITEPKKRGRKPKTKIEGETE